MKVYNLDKTQELQDYDLTKGYLISDKIITGYTEVIESVEEQFHYEIIKEYPNGGKDVKKVIDVAGVKSEPAKPIIEIINVYKPFNEEEQKKYDINILNQRLSALSQDIVQDICGEIVPDIEERKKEFIEKHNELRTLLGKEPREIK